MKTVNLTILSAFAAFATASLSAQTTVDFTAGEGYADGALENNGKWTTSTADIWQVDATAGTVTANSSDAPSNATYSIVGPSTTEQIFSLDFSFIAGTFDATGNNDILRLIAQQNGVTGNLGVIGNFIQTPNPNSFNISLLENISGNTFQGGGAAFAGADIGLITNGTNDGYADNVSDQLRLILTNIYTGTPNSFNTTVELYNVDTDTIVKTVVMNGWESSFGYRDNPKQLRFDNQKLALLADAGATVFTISAVSVPEPSAFAALAGVFALGLVAIRRRR
jgi:hypothetical protein